ncbi:hypothetical protein Acr_19g0005990 [Actinidia rufa]|uniref:Uncharacterized protein n=1 Tax=Actinidia rufa TaxID=165716 RepID=A0A7J0GA97_9ERIC|nr:hypothetical protein Acr_19g0005990 [Actinidia rufa]
MGGCRENWGADRGVHSEVPYNTTSPRLRGLKLAMSSEDSPIAGHRYPQNPSPPSLFLPSPIRANRFKSGKKNQTVSYSPEATTSNLLRRRPPLSPSPQPLELGLLLLGGFSKPLQALGQFDGCRRPHSKPRALGHGAKIVHLAIWTGGSG